jgi:hypothetical protein
MTSSESYIFLAVFAVLALVALIYLLSPMSLLEDLRLVLVFILLIPFILFFVEAGLLNCINWQSSSARNEESSSRSAFKLRPHFG